MTSPDTNGIISNMHTIGYRREATDLRKRVATLEACLDRDAAEIIKLRNQIRDRPLPQLWHRTNLPYRRELLITFHNVLAWMRTYGELIPSQDFILLGFVDERTLARTLRRFAADGWLSRIDRSPARYTLSPTQEG